MDIGYQFQTHCNKSNTYAFCIYYKINFNRLFTLNNFIIVNICYESMLN